MGTPPRIEFCVLWILETLKEVLLSPFGIGSFLVILLLALTFAELDNY